MKNSIVFLAATLLGLMTIGCTLVTDFPDEAEEEDAATLEPYSLKDNVDNPVQVTLTGDDLGTITLTLDESIPETEDGDDQALANLLGQGIQLTVKSTANDDVTASLTQGQRVTGEPAAEGEYNIALNNSRDVVDVVFWNAFAGRSLRADGSYTAMVEVQPNTFFAIGSFERDVIVTEE